MPVNLNLQKFTFGMNSSGGKSLVTIITAVPLGAEILAYVCLERAIDMLVAQLTNV